MIYTPAHLARFLLARGAAIQSRWDPRDNTIVLTITHDDNIVMAIFDNATSRFLTGAAAHIEDGSIFGPRPTPTLKAVVDALNLPKAA